LLSLDLHTIATSFDFSFTSLADTLILSTNAVVLTFTNQSHLTTEGHLMKTKIWQAGTMQLLDLDLAMDDAE
jgi:hypothetical protein